MRSFNWTLGILLALPILVGCPNFDALRFDGGSPDDAASPNVDSGVLDAGSVDAGNVDGGPTVDDAGVDAGREDGGAFDGGALDGGALDGGALDGGAFDGGALDCTPPAIDSLLQGWNCALGSPPFPACGGGAPAIVDIERSCADVYILDEFGLVRTIGNPVVEEWANCGPVSNRPIQFTDLDVRDGRAIAFSQGQPNICTLSEGECTCVSTPPVLGAAFVSDSKIYAAVDDSGTTRTIELNHQSGTILDVSALDGGFGGIRGVMGVSDDVDGGAYLAGLYDEATNRSCIQKEGADISDVLQCPASLTTGDFWSIRLSDLGEQEGPKRTAYSFDPLNQEVLQTTFEYGVDASSIETEIVSTSGLDPISFAATGNIHDNSSRVALGTLGGGVLVRPGNEDAFSPAQGTANLNDFGPLFALTKTSQNIWAAGDLGLLRVDLSLGDTTFTSFEFRARPETIHFVSTGTAEFLVVGLESGRLELFEIIATGVVHRFPLVEMEQFSSVNIPQAMVNIVTRAGTDVVILSTTPQVWTLGFNGDTPSTSLRREVDIEDQITQTLGAIEQGSLVLSAPGPVLGVAKTVWLTARTPRVEPEFVVRRYTIAYNDTSLSLDLVVNNQSFAEGIPGVTDAPFRFKSQQFGANEFLAWTSNLGGVRIYRVESNTDLDTSSAYFTRPNEDFFAGATVNMHTKDCGTVYSANSPQWYALNLAQTVPAQTGVLPTPSRHRINAVMTLSPSQSMGVGNGGHIFDIEHGDCVAEPLTSIVPMVVTRPAHDIRALEWRTDNELVVGDAAGHIYLLKLGQ